MHDTNLLKNLYGLLNEGKLDRGKFFALLSRTLVQEIGCTRASFWFYAGPLQDQAVCESLYDASDQQWSSGMVLHEDDFGDYFAAMREGRVLVASDARQHPATACFNESYFEPLNIYSLLDVGIDIDGLPLGLVCCENTAQIKEWSQPDLQYLQQAAAMVSLAMKKLGV